MNDLQHRRLSQPRLSLSLPVNEENEMGEYSRPMPEPPGMYASRPFRPLLHQQPLVQPPETAKGPTVYDKAASRVEIMASVIVPTLFLAFNFLYWPWLIACSEYFTQEVATDFDF